MTMIHSPSLHLVPVFDPSPKLGSCAHFLTFFLPNLPLRRSNLISNSTLKSPFLCRAIYTENLSLATSIQTNNSPQRRRKDPTVDSDSDPISLVNERIRRDLGKREAMARPAVDAEEADKYMKMVKEQQQQGLRKLRSRGAGDGADAGGNGFGYQVDPYTLKAGDYVVHKKVGIGQFVAIKFDVPKGSSESIEYLYIEYADGMAKLPVKQASKLLYRYSLMPK